MKIVYKDPTTLKVAPTNVRTEDITNEEKEEMKLSVQNSGIKEPIIINENDEVVSGGLRLAAALAAGLKEVPCVQKKFQDKYEERLTCFLQDNLHHPISQRAKYEFVKKAVEEDGKTFAQLAMDLGRTEYTVKQWSKYETFPEIVEKKPELKQVFFEASPKRAMLVKQILQKGEFKENPEKSIGLIEMLQEGTPLTVFEEISKDSTAGLPVDINYRKSLMEKELAHVEVKIPKDLDLMFRKKLREENRDYTRTIAELIQKYVSGEIKL
jgi:ParB/RepB/Spo0J family partition protein